MADPPRLAIQPYEGPTCPRCNARLTADWIRTGTIRCPDCNHDFEATAFTPSARRLHVAQVATAGPIEANACANHARNAAVTSCQRCGLLICALCDMNLGTGSYCPACFDRVRSEGSNPAVAGRTRDYRAMARVSAIAGFFFLFGFVGPLFGVLSLVYHSKARKQIAARGESPWGAGMILILIFAVGEIAGGLFADTMMILAMTGALK